MGKGSKKPNASGRRGKGSSKGRQSSAYEVTGIDYEGAIEMIGELDLPDGWESALMSEEQVQAVLDYSFPECSTSSKALQIVNVSSLLTHRHNASVLLVEDLLVGIVKSSEREDARVMCFFTDEHNVEGMFLLGCIMSLHRQAQDIDQGRSVSPIGIMLPSLIVLVGGEFAAATIDQLQTASHVNLFMQQFTDSECPICLESLRGMATVPSSFACGHIFCATCSESSFKSCPSCRCAIPSKRWC